MRISLFTPYSPEIGGGSVQLRSHIAQMVDLEIAWSYLAKAAAPRTRWQWLGKPLTLVEFASDLSARTGFLPGSTKRIRELVKQIDADLYWVVAHREGISVAAELLAQGKRVHLTVHDEPLAMIIRSRRYRVVYPLVSRIFKEVLLGACSVDVTSWGMRDYFEKKYGVNCLALYRSVCELPLVDFVPATNELRVGHIGSLYHPGPFRQFVKACRRYAEESNRTLKIVRIGISREMDKIAKEIPEIFESRGELEEQEAIPILANCNFLYAMYPDGFRFQGFRRTSLQIKLSTYIQAQRPIFAHTPGDSNMARIVYKYGVGRVCQNTDAVALQRSIVDIVAMQVTRAQFERLRNDLMGIRQLQELQNALMEKSTDEKSL
jgi:hypothetical protein